jgi:hypothetical protein
VHPGALKPLPGRTQQRGDRQQVDPSPFFHERGEIRGGSFESQAFRASGPNLVVSAIILWNTVYLSRAVESLRAEEHDLLFIDPGLRAVLARMLAHQQAKEENSNTST